MADEQRIVGRLELLLRGGQDLKDVDWGGKQDPYCRLTLLGQPGVINPASTNSHVHEDGGTTPVWNQSFHFQPVNPACVLKIEVWDRNVVMKDKKIGDCHLPLKMVAVRQGHVELLLPVITASGKPKGSINVRATFTPAGASVEHYLAQWRQQQQQQQQPSVQLPSPHSLQMPPHVPPVGGPANVGYGLQQPQLPPSQQRSVPDVNVGHAVLSPSQPGGFGCAPALSATLAPVPLPVVRRPSEGVPSTLPNTSHTRHPSDGGVYPSMQHGFANGMGSMQSPGSQPSPSPSPSGAPPPFPIAPIGPRSSYNGAADSSSAVFPNIAGLQLSRESSQAQPNQLSRHASHAGAGSGQLPPGSGQLPHSSSQWAPASGQLPPRPSSSCSQAGLPDRPSGSMGGHPMPSMGGKSAHSVSGAAPVLAAPPRVSNASGASSSLSGVSEDLLDQQFPKVQPISIPPPSHAMPPQAPPMQQQPGVPAPLTIPLSSPGQQGLGRPSTMSPSTGGWNSGSGPLSTGHTPGLGGPRMSVPQLPSPVPAPTPGRASPTMGGGITPVLGLPEYKDPWSQYEVRQVLPKARGPSGSTTTHLAMRKDTDRCYVVKKVDVAKLSSAERQDLKREVEVLHHLNGHPNIVSLKHVCEDRKNVYMVFENCRGGHVLDALKRRATSRFSEQDAARVLQQVLTTVAHCHSMGVMHRDLRPENFLYADQTINATLKLIDFNFATFFKEGEPLRDVLGNPYYMAPEVVNRKYGKRAEIWSCGVMLYQLLSGRLPFTGKDAYEVLGKVSTQRIDLESAPWNTISGAAKDCVRCMLERDIRQRATAADVLQHPWMQQMGVATDAPVEMEVLTRLKAFARLGCMKKLVLRVLASHMRETEVSGVAAMFREMDRDGSGTITLLEFEQGLRRKAQTRNMQLQPQQWNDLVEALRAADLNGDGTLDYHEFLTAMLNSSRLESDDDLRAVFKHFDQDGNGYISQYELRTALAGMHVSEREIDHTIREWDRNGDGKIKWNEFASMVRKP